MKDVSVFNILPDIVSISDDILEKILSLINIDEIASVLSLIPDSISSFVQSLIITNDSNEPTAVRAVPAALFNQADMTPPFDRQTIEAMVYIPAMGAAKGSVNTMLLINNRPDKVVESTTPREENSFVKMLKENYGKIGLAIGAAAVTVYLWINRDKYLNKLKKAADLLGLTWLSDKIAGVARATLNSVSDLWTRVAGYKPKNNQPNMIITAKKINYLSKRFGVDELAIIELLAFIREENIDEYLRFIETKNAVAAIEQATGKRDWEGTAFIPVR